MKTSQTLLDLPTQVKNKGGVDLILHMLSGFCVNESSEPAASADSSQILHCLNCYSYRKYYYGICRSKVSPSYSWLDSHSAKGSQLPFTHKTLLHMQIQANRTLVSTSVSRSFRVSAVPSSTHKNHLACTASSQPHPIDT